MRANVQNTCLQNEQRPSVQNEGGTDDAANRSSIIARFRMTGDWPSTGAPTLTCIPISRPGPRIVPIVGGGSIPSSSFCPSPALLNATTFRSGQPNWRNRCRPRAGKWGCRNLPFRRTWLAVRHRGTESLGLKPMTPMVSRAEQPLLRVSTVEG
jgi:hypothetical protein